MVLVKGLSWVVSSLLKIVTLVKIEGFKYHFVCDCSPVWLAVLLEAMSLVVL